MRTSITFDQGPLKGTFEFDDGGMGDCKDSTESQAKSFYFITRGVEGKAAKLSFDGDTNDLPENAEPPMYRIVSSEIREDVHYVTAVLC